MTRPSDWHGAPFRGTLATVHNGDRVGTGWVVVDASALQSPATRSRGIGRYALSWCLAMERDHPDLIGAYLLDGAMAPPGPIDELLDSGKVTYDRDRVLAGARILHLLSPFDLELAISNLFPAASLRSPLRVTATVYDLIPARDPERELIDPVARRRYRTRVELVRALDGVQVLSQAVRRDVVEMIGVDRRRVACVGAAAGPAFSPPDSRRDATATAVALFADVGLSGPYVCYPSGSHPRKNNEQLIRAWSELSDTTRSGYQLVIAGDFPPSTTGHFHHLAVQLGVAGQVVVPGYLADDQLVALIQGADLVCFPSLDEGFGLPVVEAVAVGTPVIASDVAALAELLEPSARFDPSSTTAITDALNRALTGTGTAGDPVRAAAKSTWTDVAGASATAFGEVLSGRPRRPLADRPLRRQRPRLAMVSPLPPAPTGVAPYSYRLAEEIAATEKVDLELFADGPTTARLTPRGLGVSRVESLGRTEALRGHFDQVIYVFGNSHHHLGALAAIRERRGIVVSHDVRLSNLYRHANGDPGLLPGGFARAVANMYDGQVPNGVGADGDLTDGDRARFGVLMAREVIAASSAFMVTSRAAAALARVDAGPRWADRVGVLPFAMEAPVGLELAFADERRPAPDFLRGALASLWGEGPRGARDDPPAAAMLGGPIIGHFGIVDPVKLPDIAVAALAALGDGEGDFDRATLVFVGPVADALGARLTDLAETLGVADRVGFTGALPPVAYRSWMEHATIAVQLRATSNGEASAAVGECLALGIPTVVTARGWAGGLPRDAVRHVPPGIGGADLASVLGGLLANPDERRRMADAGRETASRYSFTRSARALLQLVYELSQTSR